MDGLIVPRCQWETRGESSTILREMTDARHDPGPERARWRADSLGPVGRIELEGAEVRIGTAGWTDRTLTAPGVFYPQTVRTPEGGFRYYASCFSMVKADMGFYAIPDRGLT